MDQRTTGDAPGHHCQLSTTTFATKRGAQRWLAVAEIDIGRGDWHDPGLGDVSFEEWALRWLAIETPKPAASTVDLYRYLLRWVALRCQHVSDGQDADIVRCLKSYGGEPPVTAGDPDRPTLTVPGGHELGTTANLDSDKVDPQGDDLDFRGGDDGVLFGDIGNGSVAS